MNNYCKQEQRRMSQHKHYEILIAIANGAKWPDAFEYRSTPGMIWSTDNCETPNLIFGFGQFRLKPVPKPDIVFEKTFYIDKNNNFRTDGTASNVEFTFSGDRELKSVRLLP